MAAKSLKTSIKKIAKLSFLISLKELYLGAENLWGLIYHPFLTLRGIKKRRDFSQVLLVGGLTLFISFFFPVAIFYVLYWTWQVLKRNHFDFFIKNDL